MFSSSSSYASKKQPDALIITHNNLKKNWINVNGIIEFKVNKSLESAIE